MLLSCFLTPALEFPIVIFLYMMAHLFSSNQFFPHSRFQHVDVPSLYLISSGELLIFFSFSLSSHAENCIDSETVLAKDDS